MTTKQTISRYWCPKTQAYTTTLVAEIDGTFTITHNDRIHLGLKYLEARILFRQIRKATP